MTPTEHRALLAAVLALAMGMLLVELLAFRLCAAVLGFELAALVGLTLPAAVALGAASFGRAARAGTETASARAAAHLTALAGGALLAGAIGFSWVSQLVASKRAEGDWLHVAVAFAAWWLPAMLSGGALALAWQSGRSMVGRIGWIEGMGGAIACLLLPLLPLVEAPRATLVTSLLFGGAALLFALAGRREGPRWGALATLPLGAVVLLAGDLGSPWMRVRTDTGPRTKVGYSHWTPEGLFAVDSVEHGRSQLAIDRSPKIRLAENNKRKPRFDPQDLLYFLNEKESGSALVIGSAGGREIAVALAYGHAPIDAVELHPALANVVLADRYAKATGYLAADERVVLHIGDGPTVAALLPPNHYQRVVVLAVGEMVQSAPRLLMRSDRLVTRESIVSYLERLAPDGVLLLHLREEALSGALASVAEALGGIEHARARTVACRGRDHTAVVVVRRDKLAPSDERALTQRCRQNRMSIEHPAAARAKRDRPPLADPWRGGPATDRRPFALPPPPRLAPALLALLGALDAPPSSKDVSDVAASPASASQPVAVAAAGVVLLGVLAMLMSIPAPRAQGGRAPVPRLLSFALAPFGLAAGLCIFALIDRLLVASGNVTTAWALLIPTSLAGLGCGRLWADVSWGGRMRALAPRTMGAGLGWLLLMWLAAVPAIEAMSGRSGWVVALTVPVLFLSSAAVGAPLALGLRVVAEHAPASVGPALALHHLGWGLGAVVATMSAHYLGLGFILPFGIAAYLSGALLFFSAERRVAPL